MEDDEYLGKIRTTQHNYRTSKLTTPPATTFCPGPGLCVTIMLAAPGSGAGTGGAGPPSTSAGGAAGTTLTLPTLIPASWSATVTLPNGCPTKLGITKAAGSGPRLTSKLIL